MPGIQVLCHVVYLHWSISIPSVRNQISLRCPRGFAPGGGPGAVSTNPCMRFLRVMTDKWHIISWRTYLWEFCLKGHTAWAMLKKISWCWHMRQPSVNWFLYVRPMCRQRNWLHHPFPVPIVNGPNYSRQSCLPWAKIVVISHDKHYIRNRMNSSTSQQTRIFKVKIRHKNDAVRLLYWALINHERDTDMIETIFRWLSWAPFHCLIRYGLFRRINILMILPTAVNDCDMTKKNAHTLGLVNTTQSVAGYQVNLFDEVTPRLSKSMNRVMES